MVKAAFQGRRATWVTLFALGLVTFATEATAALTATPASHNFGTVAHDTPQSTTFQIKNAGARAVTNLAVTAPAAPFTLSNGCGAQLAPNGTCNVTVGFKSSAAGNFTGNVAVAYQDGPARQSLTIAVAASVAQPPPPPPQPAKVAASPASLTFPGTTVGQTSSPQSVTLSNSGGQNATLASASSSSAAFQVSTTGCAGGVRAGGNCTVTVAFAPQAAGSASGTVTFKFSSGPDAVVQVAGTGVMPVQPPRVTAAPASLSFPSVTVGQSSAPQTITLSNAGGQNATITSATSSSNAFAVNAAGCAGGVRAGNSCTVSVTFSPQSAGAASGTLTFKFSGGPDAAVQLSGTGAAVVPPARITASPPSLSFGNVTTGQTAAAQTITLSNGGGQNATITSATASIAGYTVDTSACAAGVRAGNSCTVSVAFAPQAAGNASGTLTFKFSQGPDAVVRLAGTGVAPVPPARVAASPASLAFGNVTVGASSAEKTIALSNQGGMAAALNGAPQAPAGFVVGTAGCPSGIPKAPQSCNVTVKFVPQQAGAASGNLTLTFTNGPDVTVQLSGTGVAPTPPAEVVASPASLAFGNVTTGTRSTAQTIALSNRGGLDATISGAPTAPRGYTVDTSGCAGNIPKAPATCNVSVVFAPQAAGAANGDVAFKFSNGPGAKVTLSGTGVAPTPPAAVAATPATLAFGNVTVGTRSTAQTIALSNRGGLDAAISGAPTAPRGYTVDTSACAGNIPKAPATCNVSVVFAPQTAGQANGNLTIKFSGGPDAVVALTATATAPVPPAHVAATPSSLAFGNVTVGTRSEAKTIALSNRGGMDSALQGAPTAPAGYVVDTRACAAGIPKAPQSCDVSVVFAPKTAGPASGKLTFKFTNGPEAAVDLSATAVAPVPPAAVAATPASLAFGNVTVGTRSETKTIALSNRGGMDTALQANPTAPVGYSVDATACNGGIPKAPQSCNVNVVFAPQTAGAANGSLTFKLTSGADVTVGLTATAVMPVPPAAVTITPKTYNFRQVEIGVAATQELTLKNTGGKKARLGTLATTGAFSVAANCNGAELASQAQCKVVVTFRPTEAGATPEGTLTVPFTSEGDPAAKSETATLNGSGVGAAALAAEGASPGAFGSVAVGGTKTKEITIKNTGRGTATLGQLTAPAAPFSVAQDGNHCTGTLAPNASCKISLVYSPVAAGSHTGSVTLAFNNGLRPDRLSVELGGTAVGLARVAANPTSLDFGSAVVGSPVERTVAIANSGQAEAKLGTPGVSGAQADAFVVAPGGQNGCQPNAKLAAGASCQLKVTFRAKAAGRAAAQLDLPFNDGSGDKSLAVSLAGVGAALAELQLSSPGEHDFGAVAIGQTADKAYTLTNAGQGRSGAPRIAVAPPFSVVNDGCSGKPMSPAATCQFTVRFAPTAPAAASSTITITYQDGSAQEKTLTTSSVKGAGRGTARLAFAEGTTLEFGRIPATGHTDRTVTLTNAGQVKAALGEITATAPFTVASHCGRELAPGATCRLDIVVTPTAAGKLEGTLSVPYGNETATLALSATAFAVGSLAISEDPAFDFGNVAVGGRAVKDFTVTNTGAGEITLVAFNGAAPFAVQPAPNCRGKLAPQAACGFRVTFSPTAGGKVSGAVEVVFNDGTPTPRKATRPLSGTGVELGQLAFASGGLEHDFGQVQVRVAPPRAVTFTVTNVGRAAVTLGRLSLPDNSPFRILNHHCVEGQALQATQSCPVTVGFSPTAVGPVEARLELGYHDGAENRALARKLLGSGYEAAKLGFGDVQELRFGRVPVGSHAVQTVTLSNTGGGQAAIGVIDVPAPFRMRDNGCRNALAPQASCTIRIAFAPKDVGHAPRSALRIEYSSAGNPQEPLLLPLHGEGVEPARLTISDGPIFDFGTRPVNGRSHHRFLVSNTGRLAAGNLRLEASPPFAISAEHTTCVNELAAGATCFVGVRYLPTVPGSTTGSLTVRFADEFGERSEARALAGNAVVPAILVGSDGAGLDFGPIAISGLRDHVITVKNEGLRDADLSAPETNSPLFTTSTNFPDGSGCGTKLVPGATCRILVRFSPVQRGRVDDGLLQLRFSSGFGDEALRWKLVGTGVSPALLAFTDGGTFSFSATPVGSSQQRTFQIQNLGEATAHFAKPPTVTDPFVTTAAGTTCRRHLRAGESCSITVAFVPTAPGASSGSVTLEYLDGAKPTTAVINLNGLGLAPADLVVSDAPGFDFGGVTSGRASEPHVFTVTNRGERPASIGDVKIGLPFQVTFNDCDRTTLVQNARCQIRVVFTPTAGDVRQFSDTLAVPYTSDGNPLGAYRSVSGIGLAPALLTFSGVETVDFGTVAVGTPSAPRTITVTNAGESSATVLGINAPATFAISDNNCQGGGFLPVMLVPAGGTCTFTVTYRPTDAGVANEKLTVRYHDALREQTTRELTLAGVAVQAASLAVTGAQADFGTVAIGAAPTLSFTVTNSGLGTATLQGFSFEPFTAPFAVATNGCPTTLAPSASCAITVSFTPTAVGPFGASLRVLYSDGAMNRTAERALSGAGANPAVLALTEASFDFKNVALGGSAMKTIALTNTGGSVARLQAVNLGAPFSAAHDCAGSQVAPGATCTITVTFSPTAEGQATATLNVQYDDGARPQAISTALSGTGIVAAYLALEAETFDFGPVLMGTSKQKSFTIRNTGRSPATGIVVENLQDPFSVASLCTGELPVDGTCSFTVTYAPRDASPASTRLRVTYNDGVANREGSLALAGRGAKPADLAVTDAGGYAFGLVPAGGSGTKEFTLTNSGDVPATSVTIMVTGDAFSLSDNRCGTSLERGQRCTFVVRASPTAPGDVAGSIAISFHDGVDSKALPALNLTGTGATPAVLTIAADNGADFDRVAVGLASAGKTFTVTNSGQTAASELEIAGVAPFAATANTCGTAISGGATCQITVTFSPTAGGPAAGKITVGYKDGINRQLASLDVSGTGVPTAKITISEASPYEYGDVLAGKTKAFAFTVRNTGIAQATGIAITTSQAPFSILEGDNKCPADGTLDVDASCQVTVTFSPAQAGRATADLTVAYNNALINTSETRSVAGKGLAPAKLAFTDSVGADLGLVAAGDAKSATLTLTNSGEWPATVQEVKFQTGAPFSVTNNACAGDVAPGATCQITIALNPGQAGQYADKLSLKYNDGIADQTLDRDLSGKGATPAALAIADAPTYDFGRVATGTTKIHAFVVRNTGETDAAAVMPQLGGQAYTIARNDCGGTVKAGSECSVTLSFAPNAAGEPADTLSVAYKSGRGDVTASCDVKATAVAAPLITISDAPGYDFKSVLVGKSDSHVFTVRNVGLADAAGLAVGALAAPFTIDENNCEQAANLAKDAECTVRVTFTPTEPVPAPEARLTVTYQDGVSDAARTTVRAIYGLGRSPALLALSPVTFEKVPAGGSVSKAITVSNSGHVAANDVKEAFDRETPFQVERGCGGKIEGNASCALMVKLMPTAPGKVSRELTLTYQNGIGEKTVAQTLEGEGATPADVQLTATAAFDFGRVSTGKQAALDFTFENRGETSASGLAISVGAGGPFSLLRNGCASPSGQLAAGRSCTVRVAFSPTQEGAANDELKLAYHNGNEAKSQGFPISGTGATPPAPGFDGPVNAVLSFTRPARMFVGGDFGAYKGTAVGKLARLKPDGSLDADFAVAGFDKSVKALAAAPNDELFVAGEFTKYGDTATGGIARLKADGSLNADFRAEAGFDGSVNAITALSDGSLYAGGAFKTYKGNAVTPIVRLGADGSLDDQFAAKAPAIDGNVNAVTTAAGADGQLRWIYVAGKFSTSYNDGEGNAKTAKNLVRLNADGSLDTTFRMRDTYEGELFVAQASVGGGGKLFVAGGFTLGYTVQGNDDQPRPMTAKQLVLFNQDGTLDLDFPTDIGMTGAVRSLNQDWDDQRRLSAIYVGGAFTATLGENQTVANFGRLTPQGRWDATFSTGSSPDAAVKSIAWTTNGSSTYHLVLGGEFVKFGDKAFGRFVRVGVADGRALPGQGAEE